MKNQRKKVDNWRFLFLKKINFYGRGQEKQSTINKERKINPQPEK